MTYMPTYKAQNDASNNINNISNTNGFIKDIVEKSSAYTLNTSDARKFFLCTGTFTFTLLDASKVPSGFNFIVKNNGSGTITIAGNIDKANNKTLTKNESIHLYSSGSIWASTHVASWISS